MEMLLAVCVLVACLALSYVSIQLTQANHRVEAYKALHNAAVHERNDWEAKAHEATSNMLDAELENSHLPTPTSHDVEDVDVETIMAGSDDPVWDIVIDCRDAGVMAEWLAQHPDINAQLPHRRYGGFATFILQLPENQQSVQGVRNAVMQNA